MLDNQRDLFSIPDEITYLNCAYMSPLLRSTEQVGMQGVMEKSRPWEIEVEDFFSPCLALRKLFGELIHCDEADRISLIPSASYGIANVINNLPARKHGNIVLIEHQFPSNVYAWQKWASRNHIEIRIVQSKESLFSATDEINYAVLSHIDENTIAVAMAHIHWADGRLFDLKAIRKKTDEFGAYLIIDGTQSIGALPFSIAEIRPDALIVASYKWLLGPYGFGLAYYGDRLDNGNPIEENWINRKDSHIFQKLVNYQIEYKPMAHRYNVGEHSNFVFVPMLLDSLSQIKKWGIQAIQDYTENLVRRISPKIQEIGCTIEQEGKRANHLFGIYLGKHIQIDKLKDHLKKEKIHVSFRGDFIRVSPHLYNTSDDLEKLTEVIKKSMT